MRWRFLLLMFGVTLVVLACNEVRLWLLAGDAPHRLDCTALGEHGPGDNAHVEIDGGLLCEDAFVFEQREGRWIQAWVPMVPRDSDYAQRLLAQRARGDGARLPPPDDVRVLVKLSRARSFADVQAAARRTALTGVVVNAIEPLGDAERQRLQAQYPFVDFSRCWILDLDRAPASALAIAGYFGAGLFVVGFVLHTLLGARAQAAVGAAAVVPQPAN